MSYDAILVVSFGGPESRQDVLPFLENVLRGRSVPRERMLAVAEHYYHFEGKSPINQQTRELISALKQELDEHGPKLPCIGETAIGILCSRTRYGRCGATEFGALWLS